MAKRIGQSTETSLWHEVYHKIALQLQLFYQHHGPHSGRELFKMLNGSSVYKSHNSWLENVRNAELPSLDPIQIFVSFSRNKQIDKVRIEIINALWHLLNPDATPWNTIDFRGCPAPIALKLQYVRPESIQLQIWQLFNELMSQGKEALTGDTWKDMKNWRGIQTPSFTIFLFWIDSSQFLPLDKNTRKFLEHLGFLTPGILMTFDIYINLLNNREIGNYTQLSLDAYQFDSNSMAATGTDKVFRLVGLRILDRNITAHKILKPYQYYSFDYEIVPEGNIQPMNSPLKKFIYNGTDASALYDLKDVKVNITAIVGKNGSGKSTLLDLVLMGIYNLSIELGYLDEESKLKNLNFEIYWHTDTLYKLAFTNRIRFYRFQQKIEPNDKIIYSLDRNPTPIGKLAESFFYSILVNYSHYALNSSELEIDWVTPLSHKNDGYVSPIVINPLRTKGSIDINNEKRLLNIRLLLNLLELHDPDIPQQSFRYIENNKQLKYFSVSYDKDKDKKNRDEVNKQVYADPKIISLVIGEVAKAYSLNENAISRYPHKEAMDYYIVHKLLTIVDRYKPYKEEHKEALESLIQHNTASTVEGMDLEFELALRDKVKDILQDVKGDASHITLKFRQAINYLRHERLKDALTKDEGAPIDLDEYWKIIGDIANENPEEHLDVDELLPPPIFKLDFYLNDDDKSSFSKASSGEYQLVSVLSSILYHIRNIDSIGQKNRYNYVAVLLDEIELYFHPNMQRQFVLKLLEALSKLDTELYGIHILFSTHSPFILSDLQQQKILKLTNGEVWQHLDNYNTFAANIHDLLADDFFLEEGYMGAFAQKRIEISINLLNYITASNQLNNVKGKSDSDKERQKIRLQDEMALHEERLKLLGYWGGDGCPKTWNAESEKDYLSQIIKIIGEPLIRDKLTSMFRNAYGEEVTGNTIRQILDLMKNNNIKITDLQ